MAADADVQSVVSDLLTEEENGLVVAVLGKTRIRKATAMVQMFHANPDPLKWTKFKSGVVCLVKDNRKKSYLILLIDLATRSVVYEQELYHQLGYKADYKKDALHFYSFQGDNFMIGMDFADKGEAAKFCRAVEGSIHMRAIQRRRSEHRPELMVSTSSRCSVAPITSRNQADASTPSDFKHLSHLGFDPATGNFDANNISDEWRTLLDMVGVPHEQLKDKETANFIYDFVQKHGGIEKANQQLKAEPLSAPPPPPHRKRPFPAPPPPLPCNGQNSLPAPPSPHCTPREKEGEATSISQGSMQLTDAIKPNTTMKSWQQNDAMQQHNPLQVQKAATKTEREPLETKQQSDNRTSSTEQRSTEQELRQSKQLNDALQQQIILHTQNADERVKRAEERVKRAEERAVRAEQQSFDYSKCSWRVKHDEVEVIGEEPLGVGGWGEVRVAMFRGTKVAAKFIHKAIMSQYNVSLFQREMNMAACIRHPNLLLFIGASYDDNKPVILTELMPANLRSIIETLSPDHVISIGTDVARGLNYLHLMRPDPIIHRDVSSANVLLEPIGLDKWKAKVSDYGSANFLSRVTTMGPGNASYAAPESMNPRMQSPKMDVYSYGILLLEMATRQFPDYSLQAMQLDTLNWKEIAMMIRKCICEDPANRPIMKDILVSLPELIK